MNDLSLDQFIFGRSTTARCSEDTGTNPASHQSNMSLDTYPINETRAQSMDNLKSQIQSLNAAKSEVQGKLDAIFEDQSRSFIKSMANLAEIDNEKLVRLMAEALNMQLTSNWKDDVAKPKFVQDLAIAFDQIGSDAFFDIDTGWKAAEYYSQWEKEQEVNLDDHVSAA